MDREFWISRWASNRIGFHVAGVNPLMERFWPRVAATRKSRVLVPLCGKSEDLRWLRDQGLDVTGIDLSEIAARSFSSEQGIAFTETREPPFTVFRAPQLVFYAGDFFSLTRAVAGTFDFFYDRAALIALPREMRPAYVSRLRGLLSDAARGLLITVEYDPAGMDGPPFAVTEDEIRSLYSAFQIEKLYEFDCLEDEPRFKERGLRWMKEAVYLIAPRRADS